MALKDVRINILDGGIGVVAPSTAGYQAKIGFCSAGTVNKVVKITDPGRIEETFGTGPLANALYDSFAAGARVVYGVRAGGDIPGTVGAVTADKTGKGSIEITGSPLDDYALVVEIEDPGASNEATFKYSLDGSNTFSRKVTVPTGLSYDIPGTGLTIAFTEYPTTPTESFLTGDRYTCSTVAPQASVESVMAAVDILLASPYVFEFCHVVGPSDTSVWAALHSKAMTAESNFRYIHFLAESRGPDESETTDQWVNALIAARSSFTSTRVSLCAGRLELSDMKTGRIVQRNGAGLYAGRVSTVPVQQSPGKVKDGPLPQAIRICPADMAEEHLAALDEAGYITFRHYIGLNGIYITNGRIASAPDSDFRYVELRRVMDKACAEVRKAALTFMQAEIDPMQQETLAALEAQLANPLDEMALGIAQGV